MDTFLQIMLFSVMVLIGLSVFAALLVGLAVWLIDNSGDQPAH